MTATVPLNVAALRVNGNDSTNLVSQFKGRTAVFERMPYAGSGRSAASTGDCILQPLKDNDSPANPLGPGVHLHWELPDYFRRGVQPAQGGDVVFPPAPNRWLVIRYLSTYDPAAGYGPVQVKSWIIESDFLSPTLLPDPDGSLRPAVSVPLPVDPPRGTAPFLYMGRVLDAATWDPAREDPAAFLPARTGADGTPCRLTSVGFVGPSFSSYYPECNSVFGFWDRFLDVPTVFNQIASNANTQFKASYQVIGWVNEPASDPLADLSTLVAGQYARYVAACAAQRVPVVDTPADFFTRATAQNYRWAFHPSAVSYEVNDDKALVALTVPSRTLCAGVVQEVVWDMLTSSPGTRYFLGNPTGTGTPAAVWTDTVDVAVGNTTPEALSALLKAELKNVVDDPDLLHNYEYLLDALQLGLLHDLERPGNTLITLREELHTRAFARQSGGHLWFVRQERAAPGGPPTAADGDLPPAAAELLDSLNLAQKAYDQARAAVDVQRKQLFMDWLRYVKAYAGGDPLPFVSTDKLGNLLSTSGGGELEAVVAAGNAAGILLYQQDPGTGEVVGLQQPAAGPSLACQVWAQYQAVSAALEAFPGWQLATAPAAPFWLPTDPVLLMQGDRLEPVRRNGKSGTIAVRVGGQLLSELRVAAGGDSFAVPVSELTGVPTVAPATPMREDVQALVAEGCLLIPSLAEAVAAALHAQGGRNNPAADPAAFAAALRSAQGGLSPLDGGPGGGLFAAVRQGPAAMNPSQQTGSPVAIGFTFTNATTDGWPPDPVGWNAQTAVPEFTPARVDPFLPVTLVWTVGFDPLKWDAGRDYTSTNLTDYFGLDPYGVDYGYEPPAAFTAANPMTYQSSVVLSKKAVYSLTSRIESYLANYSDDPADPALEAVKADYQGRKIISQGISGFNLEQTLRAVIPQVTVEDLVKGGRDAITNQIDRQAGATPNDDWYDYGFNGLAPITTGLLAEYNFGPLRAGFLDVRNLEIVDVFGQRMSLSTRSVNPDASLQVIAAMNAQPARDDAANRGKVYLPPRLLTPTRLWFNWLAADGRGNPAARAAIQAAAAGVWPGANAFTADPDRVELNTHPAASPICGWVLPNHLDNSLFFYNADGQAIGSFGVEHGAMRYRTRAGNTANVDDQLAADIGPRGRPTVNAHVADFLWYVNDRAADFLIDLMNTIETSDRFIHPASFAQDDALAVLVGRPLALARAVLGLETSGYTLPLNQAGTAATDPFPQDVNAGRVSYNARQPYSSAALGGVRFPVRLGDLANIDEGLVGYLVDAAGAEPYGTFYSPAAPAEGKHGVVRPEPDTVVLTLNATPIAVTMLIDPRAPVHATTGILPVARLLVPPDRYADSLRNVAVTFFTHPVLQMPRGLIVPLPHEAGHDWSWVAPGNVPPVPLRANAADETAVFGYTPQTLLEGWVRLGETREPPPRRP